MRRDVRFNQKTFERSSKLRGFGGSFLEARRRDHRPARMIAAILARWGLGHQRVGSGIASTPGVPFVVAAPAVDGMRPLAWEREALG